MDEEREVTGQAEESAVETGAPSAEVPANGATEPKCNMNCDYCNIMPCLVVNLEDDED